MIYYVEDDSAIRKLIVYTLGMTGYAAEGFETPAEFWQAMEQGMPELILLDIMLPGESGLSILKRLKENAATRAIPVIMITARDTEDDVVEGLELGADDYLPKPLSMMELIARVKAVLRRSSRCDSDENIIESGSIRMDVGRHTVSVEGQALSLTLKEFELLRVLMENSGRLVVRSKLIDSVWSHDYTGADHTLDTHIQTLRGKLGRCGSQIQTVYGCGYRLRSPEK